jgi:hypothetical protein
LLAVRFPCVMLFWDYRIVCLVVCAAAAAAQASRVGATLEGIVRDTSGAAIPNSKVTLHNPLTNHSRTVTTDEQGFFRAEQLAVGAYEVRVRQALHLIGKQALERASDKPFIST